MMFSDIKKTSLLAIMLAITLHPAWAQFGPGGVGDNGEVVLWLHHAEINNISVSNTQWGDISGFDNHAQISGPLPTIMADRFDNKPGVRFNNSPMLVPDAPELRLTDEATFLMVIGNQAGLGENRFIWSKGAENDLDQGFSISARNNDIKARFSNGLLQYHDSTTYPGLADPAFGISVFSGATRFHRWNTGSSNVDFNKLEALSDISTPVDLVVGGGGTMTNATNWTGYMGELAIINRRVNEAEQIILENYLSVTFGISMTGLRYNHGNNFNYDFAGILRVDGANDHSDAKGTGMVRIDNPDDWEDGECLMWAHNNDKVISGGANENLWRVRSIGNPGRVRVRLYLAGFGITDPSGMQFIVSPNVDLSASTVYDFANWDAANEILSFENVSFGANDFFSFTTSVVVVPPEIFNCPSDINTNNDSGACGALVTWTPPTSSGTLTSSHNPGDNFPVGTTTVTYTATNGAGTTDCSFDITVSDNENPGFNGCPTDLNINTSGACNAIVNWTPPTATDNCSATITSTHDPGDTFPIGTTMVTYTATDATGNSVDCSFNVTVSDNEDPAFSNCPSDINVNTSGSCDAVVNWTPPTATDNCSATVTSTHDPGDTFPIGTTTVTYTATDATGNVVNCSFDVTVSDNEDPVFSSCPADINVNTSGSCEAVANWTPPTASDNCSATVTSTHDPGDSFPLGTTTVTYTATDAIGNAVNCSFDVTVADDEDPAFINCPADIIVDLDGSCDQSVTWTPPTVIDNCAVSTTSTHNSGAVFPIGVTTVTYTATDDAGNQSTCSFKVRLVDTTSPQITNCDPVVTISNFSASTQDAEATWMPPTFTDNCGVANVSSTHSPGARFPVGSTTVTYTAEDAAGNEIECSFEVEVSTVNTAPLIDDIALTMEAGTTETICFTAQDNEGDNLSFFQIVTTNASGVVFNQDDSSLCFDYTAPEEYEGVEQISVTVCDDGNPSECTTALVEITVEVVWQLDISQLITPNGDGTNDTWFIGNIDKYPNNRVMVFDRWGSKIFYGSNYNNSSICWNGNTENDHSNSGGAPSGTYFYTIDLDDGRSFKGYLELVR